LTPDNDVGIVKNDKKVHKPLNDMFNVLHTTLYVNVCTIYTYYIIR